MGKKKTAIFPVVPNEGARRTEEGQRQVGSTHHAKELRTFFLEELS